MPYFDAHTHIQFKSYDADLAEVLARAREANVKMITAGTQMSTSEAAVNLAKDHPEDIWAAVAVHPNHFVPLEQWHHDADEQEHSVPEKFDPVRLKELAMHPQVVAVGECGLDYFRLEASFEERAKSMQKEAFLKHIEIAHEVQKPLMIHCRSAFPDLIDILKATDDGRRTTDAPPGVIHFFTGTKEDAAVLLELGFAFTFGGAVTFPPRKGKTEGDYDEVIKFIPADRILSETDAPYVAPLAYRGRRNEPAYVIETVKRLAELKGMSEETMRDQIFENAKRVFRLSS